MVLRPRLGSGPARSTSSFSILPPRGPVPEIASTTVALFPLWVLGRRYLVCPFPVKLKALVWVVRPGPQILLLERPERRGGGLHPVTGKADPGEAPLACAEREAFEETGLRGRLSDLGFKHQFGGRKSTFEEHAFLLQVPPSSEPVISDEHTGFRWVGPGEAFALVEWPVHREALERALEALRD